MPMLMFMLMFVMMIRIIVIMVMVMGMFCAGVRLIFHVQPQNCIHRRKTTSN